METQEMKTIVIDGENLSIEDVVEVARRERPVALWDNEKFLENISRGRGFYLKSGVYAYGDKMGVGANVGKIIPEKKRIAFQKRLIDSLSCGVGEELPEDIVRAAMLLRVNSLVKDGCSAIGLDKIERIIYFLNNGITPVMHKFGSVGASGDLVPLSSVAAAIQGKGKVRYRGRLLKTASVYKKLGIKPLTLFEKEGLSLVNGTSAMTAMAALAVDDSEYYLTLAMKAEAMAAEALGGMTDPFDAFVHTMKNHEGQKNAAYVLRILLEGSTLTKNIEDLRAEVKAQAQGASSVVESTIELQDPYCIRCSPQLFGPVFEILEEVQQWITNEINSANDNPIVNLSEQKVHHTGNFSGFYIVRAMDALRLAMFDLGDLMNALKERLLNEKYNRGLGASLAGEEPGFNSGFKGVGLCLSDIFGRICFLASPYSVHRRTTESYNQDIVSFGFGSAELAMEMNERLRDLLAGVLMIAAQGVDIRSGKDPSKLAAATRAVHAKIRSEVPFLGKDRPLDEDLGKIISMVRNKIL
ncbi:aromatic amino acid lyase [Candidatus Giovannonibacteria bacterium]|nr:aromatic amino acid lyase [Candidatus Giovannonibacteria bacterium]